MNLVTPRQEDFEPAARVQTVEVAEHRDP
jgi:hypothetical protein